MRNDLKTSSLKQKVDADERAMLNTGRHGNTEDTLSPTKCLSSVIKYISKIYNTQNYSLFLPVKKKYTFPKITNGNITNIPIGKIRDLKIIIIISSSSFEKNLRYIKQTTNIMQKYGSNHGQDLKRLMLP